MTIEEAIEIYNEVADKYNEVMALYDQCDCDNNSYAYKARIPLYNPDATEKYSNLLDKSWNNTYSSRSGVELIQRIEQLCDTLEDISLKQHGPLNRYHPNGYVQLYTDIDIDPDTGYPVIVPGSNEYVDHPNGTDVDYVDNECEDLDELDPAPDPTEFLEAKVYPIIDTINRDEIDSHVEDAVDVFHSVAALPKRTGYALSDFDYSTYSIYYTIEYTIENWDVSSDTGVEGVTWHSKSEAESDIQNIYSEFMDCIDDDYNNWLNDLPSTLSADIASLEQRYTNAVTELKITPSETDKKSSFISYPAYYYDYLDDITAPCDTSYHQPAIRYYLSAVDNGTVFCKKVVIDPIGLDICKIYNKYQSSLFLTGRSRTYADGELRYSSSSSLITLPLTQKIHPNTYNAKNHLMSTTFTAYDMELDPCGEMLLLPETLPSGADSPVDYIKGFPTLSWEIYEWFLNPGVAPWAPEINYNGTVYYGSVMYYNPETHVRCINAEAYLQLEDPEE